MSVNSKLCRLSDALMETCLAKSEAEFVSCADALGDVFVVIGIAKQP